MWNFAQEAELYSEELAVPVTTSYTVTNADAGIFAGIMLVYLVFVFGLLIVSIIAMWKIFEKAGEEGWKSIIPIYNIIVLLKIVGRPAWWLFLFFIPFVNIVVSIIFSLDLAKAFGKSELFGIVGLFLFSTIGYLMLGFGSAKYQGDTSPQQVQSGTPTPLT